MQWSEREVSQDALLKPPSPEKCDEHGFLMISGHWLPVVYVILLLGTSGQESSCLLRCSVLLCQPDLCFDSTGTNGPETGSDVPLHKYCSNHWGRLLDWILSAYLSGWNRVTFSNLYPVLCEVEILFPKTLPPSSWKVNKMSIFICPLQCFVLVLTSPGTSDCL